MALLPDLVGRIRLDMSELDRARGEATSRGAAIGTALGSAVGSLAGGLLAAAGQKVLEFVSGSVDAFARLEDATSVTQVKFGEAGASVQRFADTAATSFGLSKSAALEASNTFGTFGKAVGLTGQPLADFSTQMTGLAGDMASFAGTTPDEAVTALGAAFRGEYDPIERFGVLINKEMVNQKALQMGLAATSSEITKGDEIIATRALIMEQTGQAQGDFARTSDSVANSQKRMAAETENAQAALGEKLAPAFLAMLTVLNQAVTGVTGFLDVVGRIAGVVYQWRDAVTAVLVVIGILNAQTIAFNVAAAITLARIIAVNAATQAWTAIQWLLNAALTANPIGLVIAAVAALVAGIVIAYNHSETFRNAVDALFAKLKEFVDWCGPAIEQWASKVATSFGQAVTDVTNFGTAVGNWGTKMKTSFTQAYQDVEGFGAHVNKSLSDTGNDMTRFGDTVNALPPKVAAALSRFAQMLWDSLVVGWNRARDESVRLIGVIVADVQALPGKIMAALQALPGQMVNMGRDIMNGLLNGLQQLGPQIVSYLTNLIPEPVRNALNIHSPSGVFREIGQNIMQGLQKGLDDLLPQLRSKLDQIITMVKQGGQAAGSLDIMGQKINYNVSGSAAKGVQGSATIGGQQVSGSISPTGQIQAQGFGQSFNIDARSFGTQLNANDVVNQILWKAKAGGLVPA
jgi:phage-related protein